MKNFFFSLFAFFILSLPALSQWSSDPTVNTPVCTLSSRQEVPQIISDSYGGCITVWSDFRNGNWDIYVQKFNSEGVAQWTTNGIAVCTASNEKYFPQLCPDGNGGAIITWRDLRNGNNYDIYAQKVNSAGVPQWTPNGIAVSTANNHQFHPQICSDGNGGAVISWQDDRNGNYDIYAAKINSNGTLPWTSNGVAVCTASNNQENTQLTSDGSGGAVITWHDYRNGNYDIYASKVNSDGSLPWTVNGIPVCTASNIQSYPQIERSVSGGAIIAWQDYRSGTSYDIYASKINSNGIVQWSTDGIPVCTASSNQHELQLTSDGSGGVIITFQDYRSGNSEIYASKINSDGSLPWTLSGIAVCTARRNFYGQFLPQLCSDDNGCAIISWQDYRIHSGNGDIYIQNISSGGQLGVSPPTLTTSTPSSITYNSASSGGNITDDGGESVTARGVAWSTSVDPTTTSNLGMTSDGTGTGSFTSSITGLSPNTLYHVRAYATNSAGTSYGDDLTFTTLPNAPICSTATNITQTGFTANWGAPGNQGSEPFTYTLEVHTSPNWGSHIAGSPFENETGLSKAISGLSANTQYFIRVKAVNATGGSSWCESNVTTLPNAPAVSTNAASSITTGGASANGDITNTGGVDITKRGFYYNTAGSPDASSNVLEESGTFSGGVYSLTMSSLVPNTKYYCIAFAENSGGTGTGNEVNFTTLPNAPICSTATNISQTGFTANWGAPGNQGSEPVTYTLEVHTSSNWGSHIAGSPFENETGLSKAISGLNANTQYFIRVKAVNATGGSSWCESSVTTLPEENNGPSQQAASLVFSNVRKTSIDVRWTRGNGDGSFLVIKRASALLSTDLPVDNTVYRSQNRNYLMAPTLGTAKIAYYGTGNICYVTGLSGSTTYYFMVCAYNGSPSLGTATYNRSTSTNNPRSVRTSSAKDGEAELISSDGTFSLGTIYPNPAKDNIEFILDVPSSDAYTIEIYNEAGEMFPTGLNNISYPEGLNKIKIGTLNLTSGAYTLIVKSGNSFALQKFIISR